MIKGLYKSASGMLPNMKKQELTANNVSNVSTPGYKKDSMFTKELSRAEQKLSVKKSDWQQPIAPEKYVDFESGVFDRTGNALDLAIDGDGFFTIQLEDGSTAISRNGSFTINSDGLLSVPGGGIVMAEGGAVEIGNGQVTVSAIGNIEVDGASVGKITPVTVNDLQKLEKIGRSMFLVPQEEQLIPVTHATIQQGYIESSNVDIVSEMVNMIIAYRNYEANAKALQTQDTSLGNLFNRVGGKG
ncbi:MAG: flagellar hook-basal body protein [bacterium]